MISNRPNTTQPTKQRQLNTCLHKHINRKSSSILEPNIYIQPSLENTTSKMSTLTSAVAAATGTKKPPMEAVVVNSIIYSKPSFCRISVDFEEIPTEKNSAKEKLTNGSYPIATDQFSDTIPPLSTDLKKSALNFHPASCLPKVATTSTLEVDEDTKLYRMCTTINGTIHHHISELCDNILAMAGFYDASNNDNDDDSFIEFAYRDDVDEDDDEEDDDDDDDFIDDEDYIDEEIDDDNDVVDFSYECPIEPAPKLNCDKKKKVRFNNEPTVHVMHTWSYAYQAARKGEWEMYARDRERFKLRIQRTELTLNPILKREHRQKIYEKRFANLYNKADGQDEPAVEIIKSNETSANTESKNTHQKKKRRKRRFCKMGNKHYF